MQKKELRKYIRAEKKNYCVAELARLSYETMQILLAHPSVKEAETILLYHSLPDEVDTCEAMQKLVSEGKTILLPKVISDTEMTIHQYIGEETLNIGGHYGIKEPDTPVFTDYSTIDLAIIPGMAFDNEGHRLGRGKGYYDRFLSRVPNTIYKIGVCFPFQLLPSVPFDENDIIMDEIVSLK